MNASLSSAIVATIVAVTVTIGVSLRRPYRGIYGQFGAFSFHWSLAFGDSSRRLC